MKPEWEDFAEGVSRMKIDGGWLYITPKGLVFVPEDHRHAKLREVLGEPE